MARFSLSDFTLESFRRQLANVDALPQLCVLGLVSGVITGAVMVAFRLLLEAGAALYMPAALLFKVVKPICHSRKLAALCICRNRRLCV